MKLIYTGRKRDAIALNGILRADGIETTVMTAADPPNAAVFLATDEPVDRTAIAQAIERIERERDAENNDIVDEDTPKRAPEALYWRAFAAMRTAHARIEPYEQAEEAFEPDDVEWAASIGLDGIYTVLRAVEAERGNGAWPSDRRSRRPRRCSWACGRSRWSCATRWPTAVARSTARILTSDSTRPPRSVIS